MHGLLYGPLSSTDMNPVDAAEHKADNASKLLSSYKFEPRTGVEGGVESSTAVTFLDRKFWAGMVSHKLVIYVPSRARGPVAPTRIRAQFGTKSNLARWLPGRIAIFCIAPANTCS